MEKFQQDILGRRIVFYTNSQPALKDLSSYRVTSSLVFQRHNLSEAIAIDNYIQMD